MTSSRAFAGEDDRGPTTTDLRTPLILLHRPGREPGWLRLAAGAGDAGVPARPHPTEGGAPAPALHRPRNPERPILYQLVRDHFEQFALVHEERFEASNGPLRPVVRRVVNKFLDCGLLENCFARVCCPRCRAEPRRSALPIPGIADFSVGPAGTLAMPARRPNASFHGTLAPSPFGLGEELVGGHGGP